MPRIPVATEFGVNPAVTPDVRVAAPQVKNIAADQTQQMGQAVGQLGDSVGRIQMNMMQQANKLRLDDATTQAQDAMLRYESEYKQLKGKDALFRGDKPLDAEYDAKLESDLKAIGATLGNDAQRQAWELQSSAMRRQFKAGLASHIASEFATYNQQVQAGKIATGASLMADKIGDPVELSRGRGVIADAVKELHPGQDPDFVAAKTRDALTPAHAAVIDRMIHGGQTQAARDYFAQIQDDLTPDGKRQIGSLLQVSASHMDAMGAVDEITSAPDWTTASADKALRERFRNDPETLKVARAEMAYRDSVRDESGKEVLAQFIGPVNQELADAERAGRPVSMSSQSLLRLAAADPTKATYQQMVGRYADYNAQLQARAQARADRLKAVTERGSSTAAAGALFDMATNPEAYKGKDISGDLRALVAAGKLKPEDGLRIHAQWQKLQNGEATPELATFGTAEQLLNDTLAGSYISKGPGDTPKKFSELGKEEQAAMKAQMRASIDNTLQAMQVSESRKYGPDDIKRVVLDAFRATTQKGWMGDPESITVADPAMTPVRTVDRRVNEQYSAIPPQLLDTITASLKRNGQPVTKANVIRYYKALGN